MKRLDYNVSFTTPAFLGNAEQAGQWRTPPFKALLRQWWRVVYAADHDFVVNVAEMRREEGLLFGNAWLEDNFRKSLVRIRMSTWAEGKMRNWVPLATVHHPEVKFPVGSDLYLGYGPITLPKKGKHPNLKADAAIQVGESAALSIVVSTSHRDAEIERLCEVNGPRLERALWLMDLYGTVGGRSRNGWGSFSLIPPAHAQGQLPAPPGGSGGEGRSPLRPWRDALGLDWPHAIGQDGDGGLIWRTVPLDDWKEVMRVLAIVKIGLRTQFKFPDTPPPHARPLDRHWLSYPITRHTTKAWRGTFRLPNSLRFKVRPAPNEPKNDPKRFVGVIFHVPCKPPSDFGPDMTAIVSVWRRVHALLDECTKPRNQRTYAPITDAARRDQLKPQLDELMLHRIPE